MVCYHLYYFNIIPKCVNKTQNMLLIAVKWSWYKPAYTTELSMKDLQSEYIIYHKSMQELIRKAFCKKRFYIIFMVCFSSISTL